MPIELVDTICLWPSEVTLISDGIHILYRLTRHLFSRQGML